MTRDEWSKFSNNQMLDYLFNWNMRLEEAVKRLDVSIQLLDARLKISTEMTVENDWPTGLSPAAAPESPASSLATLEN
jgi:hypothetical protein